MAATRNTIEIERAAEIDRKASDEATRTLRNITDEAAQAGEQATRTGADIARCGAETVQDTLQSGLNTIAEALQRITDRFTQVLGSAGAQAEELARRSSQNFDTVWQASTDLAKGAQEISQEWLRLMQDRFAKNLDALNRLAGCRSVQDLIAVQSDVARNRLADAVDGSRRLAQVSVRVADEAARVIQAEAGRNAVEVDRNADRARRAA